jgi:excisionase family DNA binding protein
MQNNTISEYLTPRDIADILKVDISTVRRWIKKGALPSIELPNVYQRLHRSYRVPRKALQELIEPVIAI